LNRKTVDPFLWTECKWEGGLSKLEGREEPRNIV
jgi:hypothetical protein